MNVVRSIEPLSMRVAGINIDSIPDLLPLPLENIRMPTLIVSARDHLFNTLPAAEFAASKIPKLQAQCLRQRWSPHGGARTRGS
jgi:2-hydroxy-6-oxonona-2,4-dienedioate hydrolase